MNAKIKTTTVGKISFHNFFYLIEETIIIRYFENI